MSKIVFNKLINIAESVHKNHPLVNDFCEFPDDIQLQDLSPNHIIPSTLLQKETSKVVAANNPKGIPAQSLENLDETMIEVHKDSAEVRTKTE